MSKEVVQIFVDFSNLWMNIQSDGKGRRPQLPFEKLHNEIVLNREMGLFSTVYSSMPPQGRPAFFSEQHEEIFHQLGYKTVALPLKKRVMSCHQCSHQWYSFSEKTVDAALITGMFVAAMHMTPGDRIALVSGDGDFLPATRAIQDMGIEVEVWGFEKHTTGRFKKDPVFGFRPIDQFLVS